MPSHRHEALVELFRNQPELIQMALSRLEGVDASGQFELVQVSETYGEAKGAARAADLVLRQVSPTQKTPHSFIGEVQLGIDAEKRLSWPLYAIAERARQGGGFVEVVVITPSRSVAKWAAQPIELDTHNRYHVTVLGPEHLPSFDTPEQAAEALGLAMLWALGQRHEGPEKAALAAHVVTLAARTKSDHLFVTCYDALRERLDEAALAALEKLMQLNPDNLATEFSRKHVTSGLVLGKRQALLDFLEGRGLVVSSEARQHINDTTDLDLLTEWTRRAGTVQTVDELFED